MNNRFNYKGVRFRVVKNGDCIRRNLMMFDNGWNAWVRLGSCDSIETGREMAVRYLKGEYCINWC